MEDEIGPWEDGSQLPEVVVIPPHAKLALKPMKPLNVDPGKKWSVDLRQGPKPAKNAVAVQVLPILDGFPATLSRIHGKPKRRIRVVDSPLKTVVLDQLNLLITPMDLTARIHGKEVLKPRVKLKEEKLLSPGYPRLDSEVMSYWGVVAPGSESREGGRASASPGKAPRVADMDEMKSPHKVLLNRTVPSTKGLKEFEFLKQPRFRHSRHISSLY